MLIYFNAPVVRTGRSRESNMPRSFMINSIIKFFTLHRFLHYQFTNLAKNSRHTRSLLELISAADVSFS